MYFGARKFTLMSKAGKDLLWSLLGALGFMFLYGYTFNCSDQEEHLPQVYKLLNPALYSNDYFVEAASSHFTIRYFYVKLVYSLALLFGPETAVFTLYILCLWFCFYFLLKTASHFFENDNIQLIAGIITPMLFNSFTTGGNSLFDTQLICTSIAMPLCLGGIYMFLKKEWLKAGALCGAASLFQVLMGLQTFFLFMLLSILSETKFDWKLIGKSFLVFIVVALPMLSHILYNQFGDSNYNKQIFYEALYFFRNPHHYIPSRFAVGDYLKTMFIMCMAILLTFVSKNRFLKFLIYLNATVVILLLFYFLLFEVAHFMAIGKTQLFKITLWLQFINGIFITGFIAGFVLNKIKLNLFNNRWILTATAFSIILFSFIVYFKKYFPEKIKRRYSINNDYKSDLTLAHDWLKQNTKESAMVISFADDNSLLCESQRPVLIAYKAIIHEPWFLNNWMLTFKKAYNIDSTYTFKNTFNLESIKNNSYINDFTKSRADYFIAKKGEEKAGALQLIYSNNSYCIFKNTSQL